MSTSDHTAAETKGENQKIQDSPANEAAESSAEQATIDALTDDEFAARAFELEQRFHSIDLRAKRTHAYWINPLSNEVLELLSDRLGVDKGELLQIALWTLWRNTQNRGAGTISDLMVFADELTLVATEHSREVAALQELAVGVIESEATLLSSGKANNDR